MSSNLSLTLVTPVLNGADHIANALKSVATQDVQPVEHLVYDAGSTDGTDTVVKEFSHCTLISEPDDGAHDAMNKGIARAQGDWIAFLNADDRYLPGLFEGLTAAIENVPAAEMVMTGSRVSLISDKPDDQAGQILIERRLHKGDAIDPVRLSLAAPCLNARFFKTETLRRAGGFDNAFYVSADRKLLLELASKNIVCAEIPEILFEYGLHAGSQTLQPTPAIRRQIIEEHIRIAEHLLKDPSLPSAFPGILKDWRVFENVALEIDRPPRLRDFCHAMIRRPAIALSLARTILRKRALAKTERRSSNFRDFIAGPSA